MSEGQLTSDGVRNLTAIGNLINWQKIEYNFGFHQIDFSTDIPCLVLSEGRSILPSDHQLMLKPEPGLSVEEQFSSIGSLLSAQLLERLRKYLTMARALAFEVPDHVQSAVQQDFVSARQNGNMTVETMHSLLVLAKMEAVSRGIGSMSHVIWEKAKALDKERQDRANCLPQRARASGPVTGGRLT